MNKRILTITFITLMILPSLVFARNGKGRGNNNGFGKEFKEKIQAYRTQQKEEREAFRESVKDMDPSERYLASKEHRAQQHDKSIAFHENLHNERMIALEKRLSNNSNLSNDEKTDILDKAEERYQENVSKKESKYNEATAYIEEIHNDENLSFEEKREAIKSFHQEQREERKKYQEQRKQEKKEYRKERREQRRTEEE